MKNRQFKLRALAGGLAAITLMSNLGTMTVNACELNQDVAEIYSEVQVESEELEEHIQTEQATEEIQTVETANVENNDLTEATVEAEVTSETVEAAEAENIPGTDKPIETEVISGTDEAVETKTEGVKVQEEQDNQEFDEVELKKNTNDEDEEFPFYRRNLPRPEGDSIETPEVSEEEKTKFEIESIQRNEMEKLEGMTAEEILDYFNSIDSVNDTETLETKIEKNIEKKMQDSGIDAGKYIADMAKEKIKETAKTLVDKIIKELPGNSIYGGALSGLFGNILGSNSDSLDLKDVITKNAEETKNLELSMKREFNVAKKQNIDVTTLETYGSTLDSFTNKATMRAKAIDDIREDDSLNDAQKAIQIAELIGNTSEWRTGSNNGDILQSMTAAAQCFKGGTDTDMTSRDLYEAIYEFNTHDSMFSGEVMHKSEGFIQKRVKGFIRNCGVVMECLKAHKQVCRLTEEQVAALDPQTKMVYDRIKSDNKNIGRQIKNLASIFIGNSKAKYDCDKTGIFDAAKAYYQKDKTVYIDQGKQNIAVKNQLEVKTGKDYQNGDFTNIEGANNYIKKAGLKKEDLEKIANQAKANNMTLVEYLNYSGFDTSNLKDGILATETYDERPGSFAGFSYGSGNMGIKGYQIDSKKGEYQVKDLSEHVHYHLVFGQYTNDNAINKDVKLVNFAPADMPIAQTAQ